MSKPTTFTLLKTDAGDVGTVAKSQSNNAHHHVITAMSVLHQGNAVVISPDAGKQGVMTYLTQRTAIWLACSILKGIPLDLLEEELKTRGDLYRLVRIMSVPADKVGIGEEVSRNHDDVSNGTYKCTSSGCSFWCLSPTAMSEHERNNPGHNMEFIEKG